MCRSRIDTISPPYSNLWFNNVVLKTILELKFLGSHFIENLKYTPENLLHNILKVDNFRGSSCLIAIRLN